MMNKREAYKAAQACARVVDDFGAVGTVVGWMPMDEDRVLVRWDGEVEGKLVHRGRIRLVEAQNAEG
jgi:hypothetical protein